MPERRKEDEKMFLVTDLTHKYPRTTQLNDTKDVGDVIVGITGNAAVGRTAELIAANMQFGNEFTCADTFRMRCVQNNDVTVAIAEDIAAVAHAKMARCMDDYAERIWAFIQVAQEKCLAALKQEMDAKVKELQATALYEMLAEKDPALAAMLQKYKTITGMVTEG